MNREEEYLKKLIKELSEEKAPEGITQLIMQKIATPKIVLKPLPYLRVWQTQAFYLMIAIVSIEAWLLWTVREWLSISNLEKGLKVLYIQLYNYFAVNDFSVFLLLLTFVGVSVYLFVKDRLDSTQCCIGNLRKEF